MYRFKLYDEDDPLADFGQGYAPDYDTSSPPLVGQLQEPPDSLESLLSPDSGSYQPSMMPSQDHELEQAYRNRELAALRNSSDQGYGWAEGIRDVAPAAIGLLVDGIANKGRGAANIVGVGAQQAAANQAYDRAQRQKEAELAVRLHQRNGRPGAYDPFAQQKLQHAQDRIDIARQVEAGRDNRFHENATSRDTFGSERNQTKRDMSYATKQQGTQAELDTKHANVERTAGDEGAIAAARSGGTVNARTNALRDNPEELTADQVADNARADEQLQVSKDLRQQGAQRAIDDKRIQHVNDFNAKNKDALEMVAAASELRKFFEKKRGEGVTDLPGIGPVDSSIPDQWPEEWGGPSADDKYVRNLVATLQNPGLHARYGASLTAGERGNAEREFGAMKGNDEAAILQAIENLYKTGSEKLRGASVGQEDIAREILTQRGLGHLLDAPGAPIDPGAAMPQMRGLANPPSAGRFQGARELGVAPSPARGGGTVTVRLGGQTQQVTPEEAEALQQLDPRVEVLE